MGHEGPHPHLTLQFLSFQHSTVFPSILDVLWLFLVGVLIWFSVYVVCCFFCCVSLLFNVFLAWLLFPNEVFSKSFCFCSSHPFQKSILALVSFLKHFLIKLLPVAFVKSFCWAKALLSFCLFVVLFGYAVCFSYVAMFGSLFFLFWLV